MHACEERFRLAPPRRAWGTLFWVLALAGVGAVLLLRGLGYSLPIWQDFARYWPTLCIAWAMVKFVDYSRFRGEGRALFQMGEVALLSVVVVAGAAFTVTAHLSSSLGFLGITLGEDSDLFDMLNENHEFVSELVAEVGPGAALTIHNFGGSVDVVHGSSDRIAVEVRKTVRAGSSEEAEFLQSEMIFTIVEREGGYDLLSNRAELAPSLRWRFNSSLFVEVPREASVTVGNGHGAVRVSDLSGAQHIENRYGNVTLRNASGLIEVTNRHGDIRLSFEGQPSNSITVTGSYSDIDLELPRASSFSIDLETRPDSFDTDFEGFESRESDVDLRVTGRRGVGGPHIKIVSESGSVRLSGVR